MGDDEMLWLRGTTPDDETKELAREHCEAGTAEGAEKQKKASRKPFL